MRSDLTSATQTPPASGELWSYRWTQFGETQQKWRMPVSAAASASAAAAAAAWTLSSAGIQENKHVSGLHCYYTPVQHPIKIQGGRKIRLLIGHDEVILCTLDLFSSGAQFLILKCYSVKEKPHTFSCAINPKRVLGIALDYFYA